MTRKYHKIAAELKEKIISGVYPPDSNLPPELQLCTEYDVSRQTIRAALQILVDEGLIQRRQGSGSRILMQNIPQEAKQRTVAVITTNITDYIFPSVLRQAEACLTAGNCTIMLFATYNQVAQERRILLDLLNQKKIDGLLVEGTKAALPNPNLDLYRKLQAKKIPIVFFHGSYRDLENTVAILDDNYNGGRMLVEYLASKGHRKIAGLFKNDDLQGHQRYAGFVDALCDLNLPMDDKHIFWYNTEYRDILDSNSELWEFAVAPILKDCSAVVCYNDQIANTLIDYLISHDVSVPEQLAVVSFDNSVYSSLSPIRITSLSHAKQNVGNIAAQTLINLMDGKEAKNQAVPWVLIEKESS